MPGGWLDPEVFVEESPSLGRFISEVPTSVAAFVGRAARGPCETPVTVTSFGGFVEVFGDLWAGSALGFAVRDFFVNGGSSAVIVRLYRPEIGAGARPAKASLAVGSLTLEAVTEGMWGNSLRARIDHTTRPHDVGLGETPTSLFNLTILDGATGSIEEHKDLVVAPTGHPRFVTTVLLQESELVRARGVGASRPDASATLPDPGQTVWDDNAVPTNVAVSGPGLASDGQPLDVASFTAGPPGTGLSALDTADIVNLLVIPPNDDDGTLDAGIVAAAAMYCEQRRAMLLLDSPPDWVTASDVAAAFVDGFDVRIGTRSPNAALFFPRVRQPNPLHDNRIDTFGAAGAVAGVMARTDARRGVWRAPAGLEANLIGIADLDAALMADEIDRLSRMGVNCLRAVPGVGRLIWGARTLRGLDRPVSEWRYIPVRRTALFIEESIVRGTRWAVFEPNDEQLWAQIEAQVEAFMHGLFRRGAFQGTKPSEGYFVRCDRSTTTQADIARGIATVVVGFAPLKPAEFIILRLDCAAAQV